jgi:SEC-C motif-containing protein
VKPPPRDCPCQSGLRYKACCGPFHDGARDAPTPETLMRSRYAAFALGLGEYLVKTLASTHPDFEVPRDQLTRTLGMACARQRFVGLRILSASTSPAGDKGEVLFYARIFERGADRSFAERSTFVREAGVWRYATGELVPRTELPEDVDRPE